MTFRCDWRRGHGRHLPAIMAMAGLWMMSTCLEMACKMRRRSHSRPRKAP